jgi:hypothetical protein
LFNCLVRKTPNTVDTTWSKVGFNTKHTEERKEIKIYWFITRIFSLSNERNTDSPKDD